MDAQRIDEYSMICASFFVNILLLNFSNLQNRFNRFTEPFTPYFLFSKYDLIYFLTSIFVIRNERQ